MDRSVGQCFMGLCGVVGSICRAGRADAGGGTIEKCRREQEQRNKMDEGKGSRAGPSMQQLV